MHGFSTSHVVYTAIKPTTASKTFLLDSDIVLIS